jgi:AmiR/NasT family two-component response regulator
VGILMATYKLTYDEAFALMVSLSQGQHRKVRDLAEELLLTGTLAA